MANAIFLYLNRVIIGSRVIGWVRFSPNRKTNPNPNHNPNPTPVGLRTSSCCSSCLLPNPLLVLTPPTGLEIMSTNQANPNPLHIFAFLFLFSKFYIFYIFADKGSK